MSINRETCIYVFAAIIVLTIIAINLKTFAFVVVCMKASIHLHDNMLTALIRAKINFFNTNLSGQDYFYILSFIVFLLSGYNSKFIL